MAITHFSAVAAADGFTGNLAGSPTVVVSTTAALAAAYPAASNQGMIAMVTDDGVGDNEVALVVSDGSAWLKVTTTALT